MQHTVTIDRTEAAGWDRIALGFGGSFVKAIVVIFATHSMVIFVSLLRLYAISFLMARCGLYG